MKISWLTYLDPFIFSGGGGAAQQAPHPGRPAPRARDRRLALATAPSTAPAQKRTAQPAGAGGLGGRPVRACEHQKSRPTRRSLSASDRRTRPCDRPRRDPGRCLGRLCALDLPWRRGSQQVSRRLLASWADKLYGAALAAVFVSPLQRRLIESVIDVPLPGAVIYSRPR